VKKGAHEVNLHSRAQKYIKRMNEPYKKKNLAEEVAELDQCVEEFHKNPESFISIDELTAQYERGEF
jgi:hypothetical protein